MRLSHRMLLIIIFSFLSLSIALGVFLYLDFRDEIISDAEERARIILERNIAAHQYFNRELKPSVFSVVDKHVSEDYFDPVWMSSTYAIREIERIFKNLSERNYLYKEAAINARAPENEADELEKDFIERLNENDDLVRETMVREIDGKSYFQVLRRGETMESSCLRCHSSPDTASEELVQLYGPDRSFGREVGEIVSAVSIAVPLDYLYSRYGSRIVRTILVLFALSVVIGAAALRLNKKYLVIPLEEIGSRAMAAARNPGQVVTDIDLKFSKEVNEVASAVNIMSSKLGRHIENLDTLVNERTEGLEKLVAEKDYLMRELNHRVKNNLLMVSSLIRLKNAALGEKADLSDLENRINTVRIVHEKLYQSKDITHINLEEYIDELLESIFAVSPIQVLVEKNIGIDELHQKKAVALGLIINEAAANAVKHNAGIIDQLIFSIRAYEEESGNHVVVIANDGAPVPPEIELETSAGFGFRLISALTEQLEGTIELQKGPHPVFTVRFPAGK